MKLVATVAISFALAAPAAAAPWLGLQLATQGRAVQVSSVVEGSPGEAAHVTVGDQVVALDGRPIGAPEELIAAVQGRKSGDQVTLTLRRGGHDVAARLTLAERPSDEQVLRRLLAHAAPDFAPQVVAGAPLERLSRLRGQVVLLDFFATWCGPCLEAMPEVERLHEQLGPRGLRVVGISPEDAPTVAAAARSHGLRYTLVSDPGEAIAARYHVYALPTAVVIDRKGVVHHVSVSDFGETARVVRALVEAK
jgi:peroxiredoxin